MREIDTTTFEPIMAEALQCFATDVSYAVAMGGERTPHPSQTLDLGSKVNSPRSRGERSCSAHSLRACGLPSDGRGALTGAVCPFAPPELSRLVATTVPKNGAATRVKLNGNGEHAIYHRDAVTMELAQASQLEHELRANLPVLLDPRPTVTA